MAADVAGLDPLTVSLRDYIDGIHEAYLNEQARERQVLQAALDSMGSQLKCVEERLNQRFELGDMAVRTALDSSKERAERLDQQQIRDHETLREQRVNAVKDLEIRVDQRFDQNDKALIAALTAQKEAVAFALLAAREAVEKAEKATEKRFDAVNAFREQLADQASSFMPREVAQAQIEDLRGTLSALHSRLDVSSGQAKGVTSSVGYMTTAAGILITLIIFGVNFAFAN